jgi:predicted PurR-regulated permease PerM
MAYIYFTVVAIALYFFADWLLNMIERRVGKRLEYRSVVFFAIITILALGSFSFIDTLMTPPQEVTQQEALSTEQTAPAPAPAPAQP